MAVLNEHTITKNQNTRITNEKPLVSKRNITLKGYTANSMNGGIIKPIFYMPIMAGEGVGNLRFQANFKLNTPLSPSFQRLVANCRVYFVPNSRVMTNYEKFKANKVGNTIQVLPNARQSGVSIENIISDQDENEALQFYLTNTDLWRDSYISSYYPRFREESLSSRESDRNNKSFPSVSVIPLRDFKAIYNDFERSKTYDTPLREFLMTNVLVLKCILIYHLLRERVMNWKLNLTKLYYVQSVTMNITPIIERNFMVIIQVQME